MEVKREEGLRFFEGQRKNFLGKEIEGLEKQQRRGAAEVLVEEDAKELNIFLRDVSGFCLWNEERNWNVRNAIYIFFISNN